MIAGLPNTFTTKVARERGLHPRDLYSLRDQGDVIELSRGVFRKADAPLPTYPDLLAIAHRVPCGVVCCVSAAEIHDLTDTMPREVQIAVPKSDRPPRLVYPPTQIFRFAEDTFNLGLSKEEAAPGEYIRIYDPTRTVVDLMRLRRRFGEPLAFQVLRRYLASRDAAPALLMEMAKRMRVFEAVRKAADVILAS